MYAVSAARRSIVWRGYAVWALLIAALMVVLATQSGVLLDLSLSAPEADLGRKFGWLSSARVETIVRLALSWIGRSVLGAVLVGLGLAALAGTIIILAIRYGRVYLISW